MFVVAVGINTSIDINFIQSNVEATFVVTFTFAFRLALCINVPLNVMRVAK